MLSVNFFSFLYTLYSDDIYTAWNMLLCHDLGMIWHILFIYYCVEHTGEYTNMDKCTISLWGRGDVRSRL